MLPGSGGLPPGFADRSELWAQLANALQLRSAQDQVVWSVFGIFWATNGLLLVALFNNGSMPQDRLPIIVIGTVGLLMSAVWFLIQRRALGHLVRHERLASALEPALGLDHQHATSADLNAVAFERHVGRGPRARQVMPACSAIGVVGWAVLVAGAMLRFL